MTLRRCTTTSLFVFLALVAVHCARWRGVFVPVRIAGGSMAESLVGDHFRQICDACRFPCRYDADWLPRAQRVICPNCGALNTHGPEYQVARGQRVWIDRWAYRWRYPARWEVVAFRAPGREGALAVKRIVGLPGEVLEIREGRLYANGRRVRKSLSQLRKVAQLVHDQRYLPGANDSLPAARWQPEGDGHWEPTGTGFRFQPPAEVPVPEPPEFEWLAYHQRFPSVSETGSTPPIWDSYGYNQGLSRRLYPVEDLLLVGSLGNSAPAGQVAWEVHGGGNRYRVVVDIEECTATLFRNQRRVQRVDLPGPTLQAGTPFELAWCDGQLLFALGGRHVFRFCEPVIEEAAETARAVFRIGARGGVLSVDRLQVYRDLHYLDPHSTDQPWKTPYRIAEDSYFVVGDNLPISRDSRHLGVVPKQKLLGPVREKPKFLVFRRLTGRWARE